MLLQLPTIVAARAVKRKQHIKCQDCQGGRVRLLIHTPVLRALFTQLHTYASFPFSFVPPSFHLSLLKTGRKID
jgi:hypothetical protein